MICAGKLLILARRNALEGVRKIVQRTHLLAQDQGKSKNEITTDAAHFGLHKKSIGYVNNCRR